MDGHLDYGICTKCRGWGRVDGHRCPPAWLCWEPEMAAVYSTLVNDEWVEAPDLPSSDTEGLVANGARRVYAGTPDVAAEEFCRARDNRAHDWSIEVRTVLVRPIDEPAAEPSEYHVRLEMVAEYKAILHMSTKRVAP